MSTTTAAINLANLKDSIGYRKVVRPVAEVLPACRNCAQFIYDADDREGWKGVTIRRVNLRCRTHRIKITLDCVCDTHEFKHHDRRDA